MILCWLAICPIAPVILSLANSSVTFSTINAGLFYALFDEKTG
jgi:hypothetical protein